MSSTWVWNLDPEVIEFFLRIKRFRLVELLTTGDFALYTAANCLSLLGTWMQRIACSLLVWDMTRSPFWLGVLAAADLLPTVLVGPVGGAAADRWDALKLNRLSQLALAAVAGLLTAFVQLDVLTLGLLIAIVALQGCIIAMGQSARMTIVQELVGRDDVPVAVAINSMNVNLARLIGPALAGLLIVVFDVVWVFLFNTIATLIFVAVLQRIVPKADTPKQTRGKGVFGEIWQGFRFVASDHGTRLMLLLLLAGGALIRAIAEMLPAFAAMLSAEPATGLAALTSSMAFGSVMAGLTMNIYLSTPRLPLQIAVAWLMSACAAAAFIFGNSIWTLAVFAMLMGYLTSVSLIATQTYIQLGTPSVLRGRVLSVHGLIFRASPSLGALVLGLSSDAFGLELPVFCSAAIMLVVVLLFMPAVFRMRFHPEEISTRH
ncbi:MFS transporter [Rhizobium sp. BT-175]|uniref:MFS transporter n=1 Tax=Rhizobium sp. BT-175 TaxID=2986929 RepID=UPI00223664F1|nr:MFS transporter [Rhizobium sp. BT-175]MCV9947436.1 MFS transporter [Rhizobium sp. BT-175]